MKDLRIPTLVTFAAVVAAAACGRLKAPNATTQADDEKPAPAAPDSAAEDQTIEAAGASAVLTGSFLTGIGPVASVPPELAAPDFSVLGVGFYTADGKKLAVPVEDLSVVVQLRDPALVEALAAPLSVAPPESQWHAYLRIAVKDVARALRFDVVAKLNGTVTQKDLATADYQPRVDAASRISAQKIVVIAPLAADLPTTAPAVEPLVTANPPPSAATVPGIAAPAAPAPGGGPTTPASLDPGMTPVIGPVPGPGPGPGPDPDPAPTPSPDPNPTEGPQGPSPGGEGTGGTLRVFVTESYYPANLGRSGFDLACDGEGAAIDASTAWKALISTDAESLNAAFSGTEVIMAADGTTAIHPGGTDVFQVGFVAQTIQRVGRGDATDDAVWSGSDADGGLATTLHCYNWSSNLPGGVAAARPWAGGTASSFRTVEVILSCSSISRLMCWGRVP